MSSNSTKTVANVSIYNNLIYHNGSAPTAGQAPGVRIGGPGVSNINLWNNTIYGNKGLQNGYGVIVGAGSNIAIQNNIVFGNAAGEILDRGTGAIVDKNLTGDPMFLKPDEQDFRLQAHSPAIDAGALLRKVTTDFWNTPRPQGAAYDIGAYEAKASDSESPQAPKNLIVDSRGEYASQCLTTTAKTPVMRGCRPTCGAGE